MRHFDNYVGASWSTPLKAAFSQLIEIAPTLRAEYASKEVYPLEHLVLRAFLVTALDDLKVVILGQDPYHTPGVATGLAFDAPKLVTPLPPSLRNIIKQIRKETGSFCGDTNNTSWLEHLPPQGVLLLNTALTVPKARPGAHSKYWEKFMNEVLKVLQKKNLVWILWGNHAKKAKGILKPDSLIVEGAHPSPFSYKKFSEGEYFLKANDLLITQNKKPINW